MDRIDHDQNLQHIYAPEIFEPEYMSVDGESVQSELFCPRDKSRLWEYAAADGPDDYHMVAECHVCSYSTDSS